MAMTSTVEQILASRERPAELWGVKRALVVVAHPDDESFGLGAVLSWLVGQGVEIDLLCLTAGEASTVGEHIDLGAVRRQELTAAATALGICHAWLEGLPDGQLAANRDRLEALIDARLGEAGRVEAGALIAFEPSGVTGHPDHQVATMAAEAVADRVGIPVLEWGVAPGVAAALADEMGAPLVGLDGSDVIEVRLERAPQRRAITCHQSQDPANALLSRRLNLQGDTERVRIRSAPFGGRLARFVDAVGLLARPDAPFEDRQRVLDLLIGFVSSRAWPPDAFAPDPSRPYGIHCLHDDPRGWTIATVVLEAGRATPVHDHEAWGAAATVVGIERNVRFVGQCPDQLRPLDAQLTPKGAGYLFAGDDIHQASDATGRLTVSVHLLVGGGPHAHQHCKEPEASPGESSIPLPER